VDVELKRVERLGQFEAAAADIGRRLGERDLIGLVDRDGWSPDDLIVDANVAGHNLGARPFPRLHETSLDEGKIQPLLSVVHTGQSTCSNVETIGGDVGKVKEPGSLLAVLRGLC
jgi:hypothetical protein